MAKDQSSKKKILSKAQARSAFRQAFSDGSVLYSSHSRERMGERDIDTNDLIKLSQEGLVIFEPETDIKTGDFKYSIECGRLNLKVIFSIFGDRKKIRLITVMKCNE